MRESAEVIAGHFAPIKERNRLFTVRRAAVTWHELSLDLISRVLLQATVILVPRNVSEGPSNLEQIGHEWRGVWQATNWAVVRANINAERIVYLDHLSQSPQPDTSNLGGTSAGMVGPKSPSEWAKTFGRSWKTIKREIDNRQIRAQKIHAKSWYIHADDLPRELP